MEDTQCIVPFLTKEHDGVSFDELNNFRIFSICSRVNWAVDDLT